MKKFRKGIIFSSSLILVLLSAYLTLTFYIGNKAATETKTPSDAILILGARSYIDGKYNPCLKARVGHAVELYKDKYASKIIVSGGNDSEDNVNEAETMRKIAVENGVKDSDILLEKKATSTYENFVLTQEILKQNKLKSVIVVTEPFHMARAALVAEKLNYTYSVSPAAESPCWEPNHYFTKYFLKEPIAIISYYLQHKL